MFQWLKGRADGIEPWWVKWGGGSEGRGLLSFHCLCLPQRRPWLGAPLQVGLVGFW